MKTKTILDVTKDEIMIKFDKFIQDLGVPGSVIGVYDFYSAIYSEYEKGIKELSNNNNNYETN
jgi:hypothetical protein